MQNNLFYIAIGMIVIGAGILTMSLGPVNAIIQQLPDGTVRSRWRTLFTLICLFIGGYLFFALISLQGGIYSLTDLVVPGIFLGWAIFVYLVCSLSLKTTSDLKQMYVLEQETITDPLMGIYNRRYLDRRLLEESLRASRYELPFSVFLLDIDRFKLINDTYSHPLGDIVLKKLAMVIVGSVREVDVVIRYGGEEILVILPNTKVAQAVELAERLRLNIAETQMVEPDPYKVRPPIYITVSIGVAGYRFTDGWDNSSRFVERADKALYQAKELGRNRVVSSEKDPDTC